MDRPDKLTTIELIDNYIDKLNKYIDYLESNQLKESTKINISFEDWAELNGITITAKGFIEDGHFNPNIDILKERHKNA